ncbi:glycosyltransferase [Sporosarcina sp. BI001-red]|uniref:glycosyltransferase family 2 protein n=1 Tax=Sporosarcina sp. BI001-red TaxID=2282866 RepID=UPI000E22EDCA|nr:glycosyltransferase [Sporosarcina sp. BI001-red]REB08726.1 glycosyltransferase [Sporosarcina sp. BI001-red]
MNVLVSISCITYNHEDFIADAIEGFLMQKTNFDYEILIGEDCSTDRTREIVEAYIAKYPDRIKLVTSEKNVGAAKNEERLFRLSQGKYIAECEGDDYWTDPYKLQKQVDYLEENPECTMCFHAAEIVRAPKIPTGRRVAPYGTDRISPIRDIILGGGGFCPTASLVYPKNAVTEPPEFLMNSHVGDYPLQLILSSQGHAYYINECMSVYRTDVKNSWTNQFNTSTNIKERMIEVNKGDIQILMAFNLYTDFKFKDWVEQAIYEKKYAIVISSRLPKDPDDRRFEEYLKSLSIKKRFKLLAYNTFPKSYGILARYKNYFLTKKLLS